MLASVLIRNLQQLIIEHGDLEVVNDRDDSVDAIDFNNDDEECFLIEFE
jgi:hypothetical protein